ncbi:MAG TPA: COX15/CtaA family protein [Polyangiaceae bacterium]|jgi:heme A synthase|nr:COX15/CtaA family protein [Polyangiaceae bacterium]
MTGSTPSLPLSSPAQPEAAAEHARFERLAWGVLAYTVAVVLFGAVVRITGSGAGCGQHWPTCQGEIIHLPRTVATAIELSHRLTSGLSLLFVVGIAVLARRRFAAGHPTRRFATLAVALMIVESLVGAALVLLRLVEHNTSLARAAVMSVHLVNTSLLAGTIALTAWTARHAPPRRWLPSCLLDWALLATLMAALVVSVTGALTALGDTLYPVETSRTVTERLAADHAMTASLIERVRALHPLVAFTSAILFCAVAWKTKEIRPRPDVERGATLVITLVFAQVAAGVTNILLSAPGWMQVLHLGLATSLWLALVVLYATAMAGRRGEHEREGPGRPEREREDGRSCRDAPGRGSREARLSP